jgi:translation initiation factor IF-2
MSSIRISKVLSELNIGLDTAVDFLLSKDHEVEKNRNTKISDEQYALLLGNFASDKSHKDQAESIISQKREEKASQLAEKQAAAAPAVPKAPAETAPAAEPAPAAPAAAAPSAPAPVAQKVAAPKTVAPAAPAAAPETAPAAEVPAAPVEEAPQAVETPAAPAAPKDNVIRGRASLTGPKIAGKIDLTPKPKALKPAPAPAPEIPAAAISSAPAEVEGAPAGTPSSDAAAPVEGPVADVAADDVLGSVHHTTQYQKLDGPKLTGQTIDLSQFNRPKATKPAAGGEKGKRARIKTGAAGGPGIAGTGRTTTGAASVGGQQGQRQGPGRRDKQPAAPKPAMTDEQIQKQIRETLEKLTGGRKSKGSKIRRDKRADRRDQVMNELELRSAEDKVLKVTEFVTVMEVANMMNVPVTAIISACLSLGIMVTMNQRLDKETLTIVADEFGFSVNFLDEEVNESLSEDTDAEEDLSPRAPIVTVMGHVDHGKTSLLDYIRKANVIAGEAGGITQHIGAYSVKLPSGQHITFLDTPGHEAFTAMRARGAQVTDIAIIVVAADDAVMPQTKEAISHAQAAGVPIVFAINKVDRPAANPEKIKEQLAGMNLLVEDWGGKIQSMDVAAKTGLNVQELLDKVLLEAELLDLKANPKRMAKGTVIEASLDKGRGYVTTLLVQNGTLRVGDYMLVGQFSGKVRAMMDERGQKVEEAGPSAPISILGLDGAPQAGDLFNVMDDEREAKQIAQRRQQLSREQSVRSQKSLTLEEIGRRLAVGDYQELNIILKGDVDGSIEALSDSLQRLSTPEIQVNIIHKAVGQVTESDVLLASASKAIIVGFQVRPSATARKLAEKEEIEIRLYSIIYDSINDIRDAMSGMLSPEVKEEIACTVEVRETFKISKVGTIAGCMVMDGTINRNTRVRIIRDGVVIYTGELGSLKRFKDDAREVSKGFDCGLNIKNFNDIKVGDIIEGFKEVEVQRTLD